MPSNLREKRDGQLPITDHESMSVKRIKDKDKKPLFDETGQPIWGIDIRVYQGKGKPRRRLRSNEFRSRAEAEKAVAAIRQSERAKKYGFQANKDRPRLQSLISQRLPTLASKSERSRARRVLYVWLRMLDPALRLDSQHLPQPGYLSPVTIEDIDTPKIRLYVESRQADGVSASSINRELNIIGATLHAVDEFFPELQQWRPPKIPRLKCVISRREMVISDERYEKLLAHLLRPADAEEGKRPQDQQNAYQARVRVAQILQFAMLSGARHSEIVGLKWSDINWDDRRVMILQRKTGKYKQIPISTTMHAVLKSREVFGQKFVFTKGGNIFPKFYRILRTACEQCGIPYGKNNPEGIVLHTARHTVTTQLVQGGNDFDTIGQITGHSAKELILHYSHHSPATMQKAADALERIGGK